MKKILLIAGTRPEAIKLAPVYREMQRRPDLQPLFCTTGQHDDLLTDGLEPFGIQPDRILVCKRTGPGLHELTGNLFQSIGQVLKNTKPDMVMVQGDTISAFAGGWSAFYDKIPVAHLEAGLRTDDVSQPFPEEATRRALTIISSVHFAPTETARQNLLKDGVAEEAIQITGNTSIDALYTILEASTPPRLPSTGRKRILVTGHRRENLGRSLENLCRALIRICRAFPNVDIIFPVHPNPNVRMPVETMLRGETQISLLPSLNYREFIGEMINCDFIITDSGGIQEEAPALGRPVLVTRRTTERQEAVNIGANKLIGNEESDIVEAASILLKNSEVYSTMAKAGSPYGDGKAARRICDWICQNL